MELDYAYLQGTFPGFSGDAAIGLCHCTAAANIAQ
jgi:hypothetical protein